MDLIRLKTTAIEESNSLSKSNEMTFHKEHECTYIELIDVSCSVVNAAAFWKNDRSLVIEI